MNVTIEDISSVEKKLDVEIPFERVKAKLDEAYRDLARKVTVRGFRKGKVPRPVLERMFGASVKEDVKQKLVTEGFLQVAHEQSLRPVAEPVVEAAVYPAEPGHPFKFSARVEVVTQIVPKDYKGLSLARKKAVAEDKDVEHYLEHKREDFAELRPIEGRTETAWTDVLTINVHGTIGEQKVGRDDLRVDLAHASPAFKEQHGHSDEPLPGMAAALVGLPLDTKEHPLTLVMPDDGPQKELAGKTATLLVTITEAQEKVLPPLDDDFAKDTGEAETLAELRTKTHGKILEERNKEIDRDLRGQLVRVLLEQNPFDVATALVERQLDFMVERVRMQLAMQGVDPRTGFDEARAREEMRDEARQEVRASFLIDAISEQEGVKITDAELEKRVAEMAARKNQSASKMRAELLQQKRLEGVRRQLRDEKTVDLLLSQAKVKQE